MTEQASQAAIETLDHAALAALAGELESDYARQRAAGLALDLTRGKPGTRQLELSDALDGILAGDFLAEDGTDTRNYGGLLGLAEARRLGAELLEARPEQVLAGGNSSLTLMYLYVETAHLFGVRGPQSAWRAEAERAGGRVRFLCPVPGYDRHFTICESFGIEMLTVPMTDDGPDMDAVEAAVADDPLVKGIWCVPKYSNPTGCVYSDAVVERFARLPERAGANFRILWDNAYAVHDLDADPPRLAPLLERAEAAGNADAVVMLGSTSKITFAGSGIGFLATTTANLEAFQARLAALMIGPDKVNQLRHVRLLGDLDGIRAHMRRHAELVRPKFEAVQACLERTLGGTGVGRWTRPRGGYFVSFDTPPRLAREVVRLAGEAGVRLTPAGATFPYGHDPADSNIRLAPTYPDADDVARATEVFATCVKLAAVRQRLGAPR